MNTIVNAKLILPNGQIPCIKTNLSSQLGEFQYQCRIDVGCIVLEIVNEIDENIIFPIAKNILDRVVVSLVLTYGAGLICIIENCILCTGEKIDYNLNGAFGASTFKGLDSKASFEVVIDLIMENYQFYLALRDINFGLIDHDECPFFFYRAIESMAKLVCKKEEKLTATNWTCFHEKLKTSKDDLKLLKLKGDSFRHAERNSFDASDHSAMWKTVHLFLTKTINYLVEQK